MSWSRRRTRLIELQLQRECDTLKTTICRLRRELENKQGAVGRLEVLMRERTSALMNSTAGSSA
jgi:hypothetical protein